jgi:hypothetical protein
VLGLVPGKRSYECEVLVTRENVSLSSKGLAELYASDHASLHKNIQIYLLKVVTSLLGAMTRYSSTRTLPVPTCTTATRASPPATGAQFDDQLADRHPDIDIKSSRRLGGNAGMTPCALFLAVSPVALVEQCFEGWRKHAAEHVRRGLNNFDSKPFNSCIALVRKMGLLGLRCRVHHFTPEVSLQP